MNSNLLADVLLVHPPAYFDFRDNSEVYWPFLSSGGSETITPLYENFPVGFKTLQRFLTDRDHDVKILNLSTLLLKYPSCNVNKLFRNIEVRMFGIDLHWMVHVQGSLAIATILKALHPQVPIIFGGISSTYYADELIRYPFIDMVMRGYDTHEPMATLLSELKNERKFQRVPNLLWKNGNGEINDNGFTYTPRTLTCGMDLSSLPQQGSGLLSIKDVLTTENAGCVHNCGWCGGSREAFRRVNKVNFPIAQKELDELAFEMKTVGENPGGGSYNYYSLGTYSEPPNRLNTILDHMSQANLGSVMYDQFFLTSDAILRKMTSAGKRVVVNLSPQSHDVRVSKLSGRGTYTMDEMETWIEKALDYGISEIDVYFFIGMPEQDEKSVFDTVAYCQKLMERFEGQRVIPFICPMFPFLDPGSSYYENPEEWGYTVFYRTVEEHRRAMMRASLINRTNYETRWLSRFDLINVSYKAIRELFRLKGAMGLFPSSVINPLLQRLEDARQFINVVHPIDCIADEEDRKKALREIGDEIRTRNNQIFFSGVLNQAFPVNRKIGGRWYDEMLSVESLIEASCN
jgi:clorobiocin biosynthesis protein CloN6